MPFQYKKVLVIGATSGIGEALADRLISEGSFVIAVGRRRENLETLVHRHGHEKAQAVTFDITKLEAIPNFASNIINTHPDLDCIVLNSGIQRKADFSNPGSVDLDIVALEWTTNYLSYLALTKAFLPFLQSKQTECSNYCASKAALHQWILCLREQLKPWKIKVIEVFPPAVQTELHDEKHQPDIKNGRQMGMPLDEFTNAAYDGLARGLEQVPVGMVSKAFDDGFETKRQEAFAHRVKTISGK